MTDQEFRDIAQHISCLISENSKGGFGDPNNSNGDDFVTGGSFKKVFDTGGNAAVIMLKNTGGIEIEISANEGAKVGRRLAAGEAATIDKFRGTLFARSPLGASLLNWHRLSFNITD